MRAAWLVVAATLAGCGSEGGGGDGDSDTDADTDSDTDADTDADTDWDDCAYAIRFDCARAEGVAPCTETYGVCFPPCYVGDASCAQACLRGTSPEECEATLDLINCETCAWYGPCEEECNQGEPGECDACRYSECEAYLKACGFGV